MASESSIATHSLYYLYFEDLEDHVYRWSESDNGFKRHILARVGNACLAPISPIPRLVDAILGVAGGVSTIATGGMCKSINKFTKVHLKTSTCLIISQLYAFFLTTLNPKAEIPCYLDTMGGPVTAHTIFHFERTAESCAKSKNFLKRHFVSRLTYAGIALACIITRVVDGIIGLIATPLSLVTFGKFDILNTFAYHGLQTPGIIFDIFKCTIMMINPQAKNL